MSSSDNAQVREQVVTTFVDQTSGQKVDFAPTQDQTMTIDEQEMVHLTNFLSRPQLVQTQTWNETDAVGTSWVFNPWNAFFTSATTKYKLNNYAFINCTMKIKVVINASPFYFGSMLIGYTPMSGYYNSPLQTSGSTNAFIVPFSQAPHVWIYPQTNQGGEFTLPFFYHKNWLPLNQTDCTAIGKMTGIVVNQLASANGVSGQGVTIQIWAWAEDVKLLGPTINLAVQSDEYVERGVVSKKASAVANVASKLKQTPIIGPFARATELGANTLAGLASVFGFSNPPVISPPEAMVPRPFAHFASPAISTPMEKLALDPKQELSIDSRIAGLDGTDELLLANLVTRESYLTSCAFDTTTAVDTVIFNSIVTPNLFDFYYDGKVYQYYPTPVDHFSRLFQYWRGDIIFRFQFMCTQYHKARVRVTYDPNGDIRANVPDYTSVYNQIVDVGEAANVEVRVPYMQAYAWLRTRQDNANNPLPIAWKNSSSAPSVTYDATKDNGYIAVRIVTKLTAPVSSSTINMQVFVRAAENFELAGPVDLPPATFYQIQSDVEYSNSTELNVGTNPGGHDNNMFLANMGEACPSLRSLLRRTNYAYPVMITPDTTSSAIIESFYQTIYPSWYGYDANGRDVATGTENNTLHVPFNFCTVTPFHWIAPCFVGMRGSMMWHFNLDTTACDHPISSMRAFRNCNSITTGNYNSRATNGGSSFPSSSSADSFYTKNQVAGSGGQCLTNQVTNTSLQVVVPDYNYARFHFCDAASGSLGLTYDGSAYQNFCVQVQLNGSGATKPIAGLRLDKYFAVGPDFTMFLFLCAAPWIWLPSPPPN